MHTRYLLATLIAAVSILSACDRKRPAPSTTAPAGTARERAVEHLKAAAHELTQATKDASAEARTSHERSAAEARDLCHRAAQKVADATSPPATAPATQQ